MRNLTLALETGIYGGSISLLDGREEIAGWVGETEKTKSADYLDSLRRLLEENQININEIKRIVISEGPGSYTGLRIGFAFAKGLKTAFGAKIFGLSLIKEMVRNARPITIAALPFGKNEICWHKVTPERKEKGNFYETLSFSGMREFIEDLNKNKAEKLLLPERLYSQLLKYRSFPDDFIEVNFCDKNFAAVIGKAARSFDEKEQIKLFYPKTVGRKL